MFGGVWHLVLRRREVSLLSGAGQPQPVIGLLNLSQDRGCSVVEQVGAVLQAGKQIDMEKSERTILHPSNKQLMIEAWVQDSCRIPGLLPRCCM